MSEKDSYFQDLDLDNLPDETTSNAPASEDDTFGASTETDIELEFVDDTPPEDRGRPVGVSTAQDPTDDELAEYGEKVKHRMKELTFARHDERRAKEAAQREREEAARLAQQLWQENQQLRKQYQTGADSYNQMAVAQAESALTLARQKLKEAQESYDTDAIIAAQEGLAEAKFNVQYAKHVAETAKKSVQTPLQQGGDTVYNEPTLQQLPKIDEKQAKWQARNQWFGVDDEMTSLALGVHKKLVQAGVDPTSDEYYKRIDSRLRQLVPSYFEQSRTTPNKPAATVVAAPSRATAKRKVKLTPSAQAIARRLNLTDAQYAAEVLKLNQES